MKALRLSIFLTIILFQSCAPKEDPEFLAFIPLFPSAPFNNEGYFKLSIDTDAEPIPDDKALKYFSMEGSFRAQYQLNFQGLAGIHGLIMSDKFTPILYLFTSDGISTEALVLDEYTYISSTGGITIGKHGFQVQPDGTIERLGEVELTFENLSLRFRLSELGGSFPINTQLIQPDHGILTGSTEEGEWFVSTYDHSQYELSDGRKLLITGKLYELDMSQKTQLFLVCYSKNGTLLSTHQISDSESGFKSLIQEDLISQMKVIQGEGDIENYPEFMTYRISLDGKLDEVEERVDPRPTRMRNLAMESPESFLSSSQIQTDGDGMEFIENTIYYRNGEILVNYNYSGGIYMIENYSFYVANGKFVDVIYNKRENQIMMEPMKITELSRHFKFTESGNEISNIMAKTMEMDIEDAQEMEKFDSIYADIAMREYLEDTDFYTELTEKYRSTLSAAVTPTEVDWY